MTNEDLGHRSPVAFLSHASEDKTAFVRPLGLVLAKLGVQPWLDQWEIQPGDSLVQRLFDEGLSRADAVVLVASTYSVTKPWVREELDNAAVQRIQAGTRLIPVRLDDVEMPAPLRHLAWINAERTPESVQQTAQRIADVMHGHDPRPVVGERPAYLTSTIAVPGLTKIDAFILAESVREAIDSERLIELDWRAIKARAEQSGLSTEAIYESLHALVEAYCVKGRIASADWVQSFEVTRYGYNRVISQVVPDIDQKKRHIVAELVNNRPTGAKIIDDLAERADAPRLVVDRFLEELEGRDLVTVSRTIGNHSRLHDVSPTLGRLLS